jgi:hypothetical protein
MATVNEVAANPTAATTTISLQPSTVVTQSGLTQISAPIDVSGPLQPRKPDLSGRPHVILYGKIIRTRWEGEVNGGEPR